MVVDAFSERWIMNEGQCVDSPIEIPVHEIRFPGTVWFVLSTPFGLVAVQCCHFFDHSRFWEVSFVILHVY